jgi:transporter family-2 protein
MKPIELPYLMLLGLCVGVSIAAQAGINAQLRSRLNSPIQAALVSFAVGTCALGVVSLLEGRTWPSLEALAGVPAWAWIGGLLGAFNISAAVVLAPRVGALVLAVVTVGGQIFASLLLDHFGLLGYARYPVTLPRFAGAVLLVLGVYLVGRR